MQFENYNLSQKFSDIKEFLQKTIEATESYYGLIHESLPEIERNLELTDQETNILIEYFIDAEEQHMSKGEADTKYLVFQALEQIKSNFSEISELLLDQEQINQLLQSFLKKEESDEASFSSFLQLVKQIEESLSNVGDVSLNAIIFSSRLGEKGLAFRVVSDNIHQTAIALEEEFANISNLSFSLEEWHKKFQDSVVEIVNGQDMAIREYFNRLDGVFSSVTESIKVVSQILRDLMVNVKSVVEPFQELMVLIQRQDIIRQNMENTIKCIETISVKYEQFLQFDESVEKEKVLDYITFISKGTDLAKILGDNVEAQIISSTNGISKTTTEIAQNLQGVKEDATQLTQFFYSDNSETNELAFVDYTFNQVFDFMEQFMDILINIRQQVDNIGFGHSDFNTNFGKMEHSMTLVKDKVGFLNKIIILARIELARMSEGKDCGDRIEGVVREINKTVDENKNVFGQLKDSLTTELTRFEQVIGSNQEQIDKASEKVKASFAELKTANEIVNKAILALDVEIKNLQTQINTIYSKLEEKDDIIKNVKNMNNSLAEINNSASEAREEVLNKYGLDSWEEKNHELIELFKLFTSYIERQTAKEYLEYEEFDEGSEEGELTLF
ncbi:putative coiled-coil protein SlyX [Desulfitispora alkaliphila]|uniref:hypothetical protein n=1 Tax=Desulfitispora alkaliphila TaxID=622674 RepID=UPI003D22B65E